jgi:hypothetical protein
MIDLSPKSLFGIQRPNAAEVKRFALRGGLRLLAAALAAGFLSIRPGLPFGLVEASGIFLVAVVAAALLRYNMRRSPAPGVTSDQAELVAWVSILLGLGGVAIAQNLLAAAEYADASFLQVAPIVAVGMLASALLSPSKGLLALTVTAFLIGIANTMPIDLLAAAWFAGAVGAHAVNPIKRRSDFMRAIALQVVVQAVLGVCIVVIRDEGIASALTTALWAGFAGVLAAAVFWLGVDILERSFGIVSDRTLLELCSPEHPLIRELNLQAPGTYAHSVMVGNLAENAARAVGANPVLCRAMAYFHDVGKLKRPGYFIENQVGSNPHDELDPSLSALILRSHVLDGVEMARDAKLPGILVDGISQHHGTNLIAYFYHRALQEGSVPEGVSSEEFEDSFRYPGPKPQTREAAILHLADMTEAASRAARDMSTPEQLVSAIISGSQAEGQLEESDLTFRDLKLIRESFVRSLGAIRHGRVQYPKQEDLAVAAARDIDHERIGPTAKL